jgi:hypothetical protein
MARSLRLNSSHDTMICMSRIQIDIAEKPPKHDHHEEPAEEMTESHEETEPWEDAPTWPGTGQKAPETASDDAVVS